MGKRTAFDKELRARAGLAFVSISLAVLLGLMTFASVIPPVGAQAQNHGLQFDGKDDFVGIDAAYPFEAFTIQVWVNPDFDTRNRAHVAFVRSCFVEPPKKNP